MILQVKIINGVRKLVPLTTDSGQGLPLGAITAYYGTVAPSGYLLCDGSSFDSTAYPALAALLGDNHTPDLREVTLKGIGENPNATDHVKAGGLALGEFQDDRLQSHTHPTSSINITGGAFPTASGATYLFGNPAQTGINTGRSGATTEVKSVGVNYIIKAVIGPIESAEADQVVQTIKQNLIKTVEVSITSQSDGYYWSDFPVDTSKILNVQVLSAPQAATVVLSRNRAGNKTGLKFFSPTSYSAISGTFTVLITYLNN